VGLAGRYKALVCDYVHLNPVRARLLPPEAALRKNSGGWAGRKTILRARRKGHRAKVMLARRLRQETTMSLKWIAQRLQMGSWTCVSNLLNEQPQTQPQAQEELLLCQ
jgi:hypothetical protein